MMSQYLSTYKAELAAKLIYVNLNSGKFIADTRRNRKEKCNKNRDNHKKYILNILKKHKTSWIIALKNEINFAKISIRDEHDE